MSKRDRALKNKYADLAHDAVAMCRRWADKGLGFNCTFVDDDMKVIVGLAQRAILAGLTCDFNDDMQRRFSEAAEKHRADHEKSLGFVIQKREAER
jgi:hypothetical protein